MQIIITGHSLPGRDCSETATFEGRSNIHFGVQRRGKPHEILDLVSGDTETARWELAANLDRKPGAWDILGPYIQGPPRGRFIYLSWVTVSEDQTFEMFRRAKLMLDAIPEHVITRQTVPACSTEISDSPTPQVNRCARRSGRQRSRGLPRLTEHRSVVW